MTLTWDQLELPFTFERACVLERSPLARFGECPLCGGEVAPEHAHYRCRGCGWRDSCCD